MIREELVKGAVYVHPVVTVKLKGVVKFAEFGEESVVLLPISGDMEWAYCTDESYKKHLICTPDTFTVSLSIFLKKFVKLEE